MPNFPGLDIAVEIPLTSWLGAVKIGRQKVGLSQEWIMPGPDWIFMERSGMANAFIPQRNIGLRLHRSVRRWAARPISRRVQRLVRQRPLDGRANGNQYTGRLEFLPVDRNADHTVVSVATGVYYKEKTDGTLQYRSRPETNQSPYFVDTTKFEGNHSTTDAVRGDGDERADPGVWRADAHPPSTRRPRTTRSSMVGRGRVAFPDRRARTFNREDGHYVRQFQATRAVRLRPRRDRRMGGVGTVFVRRF